MPTNAPAINAESLRDAANSGASALRILLQGTQENPFSRTEQMSRVRSVTDMLPGMQIDIAKRQLILRITRDVLQNLLLTVRQEQSGQVGDRLAQLRAEQQRIIDARQTVLNQERQHAQGFSARTAVETRHFWDALVAAPRTAQAMVVGGIVALGLLIHAGWKKLPNWVRKSTLAVGGFLGIVWLVDRFRNRGGSPGTPSDTDTDDSSDTPDEPEDDGPDESDESAELPVHQLRVRCLGPGTIPPIPAGARTFLLEGEEAPLTIDQLQQRITALQATHRIHVLYEAFPGSWPDADDMVRNLEQVARFEAVAIPDAGETWRNDFPENMNTDRLRDYIIGCGRILPLIERDIGGPFNTQAEEYLLLTQTRRHFFEAICTFLDEQTPQDHETLMNRLNIYERTCRDAVWYGLSQRPDTSHRLYFEDLEPDA